MSLVIRRIIGFCGAGGTGKTSVLHELAKKMPEAVVFPSVAREYYRIHMIKDEEAYLDLIPDEQFRFQEGLQEYHWNSLLKTLATTTGPILMDQTLIDHIAYRIYVLPNSITLYRLNQLMEQAQKFFIRSALLVYCPYPASWTQDVDPDEFRYTPPGKNLILAALTDWMLRTWTKGQITQKRILRLAPDSSIAQRVEEIYQAFTQIRML